MIAFTSRQLLNRLVEEGTVILSNFYLSARSILHNTYCNGGCGDGDSLVGASPADLLSLLDSQSLTLGCESCSAASSPFEASQHRSSRVTATR